MEAAVPAALAAFCAAVAALVNSQVPDAYMDEIFHVPQTQRYCAGDWGTWDPKITTFPGLYLAGVAWAALVGAARSAAAALGLPAWQADACSTVPLRLLNLGFAAAAFATLRALYRELHPRADSALPTLMAATLALFPVHFFYCFLYYTDAGALALALAAYLACLRRQYGWCALAGAAATAFRQTNAVWAAFMLAAAALQECLLDKRGKRAAELPLLPQLRALLPVAWQLRLRLASALWPLALTPAAFAAFVAGNGGVAVGDRAAHAPVRHWAQPLYCAAFTCAALAPVLLHPARLVSASGALRRSASSALARTVAALAAGLGGVAWAVHAGTLAHPYLLADNRHYTFYLWKDALRHRPVQLAAVPFYLFAGWSIADALVRGGRLVAWSMLLAGATAVTLVPAWLLEFRYFTLPFMLVALHMAPPSRPQAGLLLVMYCLVNALTMYMFACRPFRWPDGSAARFLW